MKPISRLFFYIKKYPLSLFLSLICALVFVVSMCLTPMLFGKAIDEITLVITSGVNILDTNFFFYLIVASVLIVLVLIFEFFFEYFKYFI